MKVNYAEIEKVIRKHDVLGCMLLLECKDNLHLKSPLDRSSILIPIVYEGLSSVLTYALSMGLDPNEETLSGTTPLRLAVQEGHIECVQALLDAGALVNRDGESSSALHHAAYSGNVDMVRLLVNAGADVDNANVRITGDTPLMSAVAQGNAECVGELISLGARLECVNRRTGRTALHQACYINSTQCVYTLLEAGANVNTKDYDGFTPLHTVADEGLSGLIKPLIEYGADPSLKDDRQKTPLNVAWDRPHMQCAAVLKTYGK